MKFKTSLYLVLTGVLMSSGAFAQTDDSTFRKADDLSAVSVPGVDKDGDGCLSKTEVTPGGQLDKRFSTRDANGDGKLCKDEYFTP
ncbi:MAG: hypothetical protein ACT4PG_01965 [Panacagrimonas sp.]